VLFAPMDKSEDGRKTDNFCAVTSAALVLQMLILLGMYLTLRKLSAHINSLANEVKSHVFPLLKSGKHLLADTKRILETSSPKVELVLDNAAAITTTAYAGIGRASKVRPTTFSTARNCRLSVRTR
jgi:hypothetical protein